MSERKSVKRHLGEFIILMIIGFLGSIALFAPILECPACNNTPILEYFCDTCGGDGKICVFNYMVYQIKK